MVRLNDLSMKPKLIGLFLIVGLLPLSLIGFYSVQKAEQALLTSSFNQLQAVRDIKKKQIGDYVASLERNIDSVESTVVNVITAGKQKLEAVGTIKKSQIESYFGERFGDVKVLAANDQVVSALDKFSRVAGMSTGVKSNEWQALDDRYNPWFTEYVKGYGYYDLFLISKDGDVVYTQAKESDLGENLVTGKLKSSGLAKVFQKALKQASIVDFEPYAPSNGDFASFIGAPVIQGGRTIGVVALQMPTDAINSIAQERSGMGNTGETYLVGNIDGQTSLRSDRTVKTGKIGASKKGAYISKAFDGQAGVNLKVGSTGDLEVVQYRPLKIEGLNWVIMNTVSLEELLTGGAKHGEDFFANYVKTNGYYDLFLISAEGFIFYSVGQEADYHTNIMTGKYKDSGLGEATRKASKSGKHAFADFAPYAPSNGEPAFFLVQPVMDDNGKTELFVGLQLPMDTINGIMQERSGMGQTGETYLVGEDKRMRSDSFLDKEGHSVKASFAGTVKDNGVDTEATNQGLNKQSDAKVIKDYNGNSVLSAFTSIDIGDFNWVAIAEIDLAEVYQPINALVMSIIIIGAVIALVVLFLAIYLALGISRPLVLGVNFAEHIANGDLTSSLDVHQKDEIGKLANALQNMQKKLSSIVSEVKAATSNISQGSSQLSESVQNLSSGASEQAASVEETSSALEEMSANVDQNADNAKQTEKMAEAAARKAEEGGAAVTETVGAMKDIADKIRVIEDIAYETKILALNAAIEAARAGEHGKGFAVVAAEVRKLAGNSEIAANQISELAKSSVSVSERAGTLLNEIVPSIVKTADLVQEITAASEEQSSGIGEINGAMTQLDTVTQNNAALSEELASTAEEMNSQAMSLEDMMSFFVIDSAQGRSRNTKSKTSAPSYDRQSQSGGQAKKAKPQRVEQDEDMEDFDVPADFERF